MNQIMAMNMGADDYLTKPFDLAFVLAKIQALLRRSYQYTHQQVQTFSLGEVTFHPIENLLKSKTESFAAFAKRISNPFLTLATARENRSQRNDY